MSKRIEIPIETRQEILSLHQLAYGSRQIARRVPCSRKTVRRVLSEAGVSENSSTQPLKLQPFLSLIEQKVRQDLTTSRILREIREAGYQGGRTILAEQVRKMRPTLGRAPRKSVKRRFETPPAQEMQIDWSPYLVPVGERTVRVHALGSLLCHSRKLFAHFFPDERQSTLLEGLAMSFEYFEGCATRVVLDNMSTAVLGRYHSDGTVLWNPRFADFARHYGFEPFACKPRDADRKGKKEKSFRLLWDDFLKGSQFASWEDLNARMRIWLDHTPETANLRVHNTTRRVPNEAWHEERSLLIALPEKRFAVYEQGVRVVDADSTVSVHGTRYTVPAALANRAVEVRLFAEHFEVLDSHGKLAFSRRYVGEDQHGQLIIEPTHYANVPRRPGPNTERLDAAFVARYPSLAPLVRGLQIKMKSLAGVHLRALLRLADRYGSADFLAAAEHAQNYRRFDARAVGRILEQRHGPGEDPSVPPLGRCAPDLVPDAEPGDLDSYAHLDTKAKAERSEAANDGAPHLDDRAATKDDADNDDNDDNSQEQ